MEIYYNAKGLSLGVTQSASHWVLKLWSILGGVLNASISISLPEGTQKSLHRAGQKGRKISALILQPAHSQ